MAVMRNRSEGITIRDILRRFTPTSLIGTRFIARNTYHEPRLVINQRENWVLALLFLFVVNISP